MRGYPGAISLNGREQDIIPIPALKGVAKRDWNNQFLARGPVALFLHSAAYYDMAVDTDLRVKQLGEISFHIDSTPFQYLPGILRDRIFNHRARAVCVRSDIGQHTIDFRLLIDAVGMCKIHQGFH